MRIIYLNINSPFMKHSLLLTLAVLVGAALHSQTYVTTFPWADNLETVSTCGVSCATTCALGNGWTNDPAMQRDWLADAGGTGSSPTGPSQNGGTSGIDHNPGTSSGIYFYAETSSPCNTTSNTWGLLSPYFNLTSVNLPGLVFWYHMFGQSMGDMHLDVRIGSAGPWDMDIIPTWTDDVDLWQEQVVDLTAYANLDSVQFRVRYDNPTDFWGDAALDDFRLVDTSMSVTLTSIQNASCNGISDGMIAVDAFFGQPPFTYNWSGGLVGDTITGLPAGTYTVTATDNTGNTAIKTFTITEPNPIVTSSSVIQDIICAGDLGTGQVVATGGTPTTGSYVVDTTGTYAPDSSTTPIYVTLADDEVTPALPIGFEFTFFGLPYNEFYISANGFISFQNDGSGCCTGETLPDNTTPNNLIALGWEDLDPTEGGEINYYTTGSAPFRILVVTYIDVRHNANPETVSGQLKLFETTNCIEMHTTSILPDGATAQTQGIENFDGTEAYVYPGRNGVEGWVGDHDFISFCPVDSTGLLYNWPDGSVASTNYVLTPGKHVVTVTDLSGCTALDSVTISQPVSDIQSNIVVENVSCFGFGDGSIELGLSGGVQPYSYTWSDNSTDSDISGSGPDVYAVTVTDNVNCEVSYADLVITEPTQVVSTVTAIDNVNCEGDADGSASILTTGGTPPYVYSWLPGGFSSSTVNNLSDGAYQVQIVDASGCLSYVSVPVIAMNPAPEVDLGPDIDLGAEGPVTLDAGTIEHSYLWNTSEMTPSIEITESGLYWVQVTSSAGCVASDTINVEMYPLGIEGAAAAEVSIYPNPATTVLNIDLPAGIDALNVELLDARGSLIRTEKVLKTGKNTIDVSGLSDGVYFIRLNNDGRSKAHQFVIQR